MRLCSLPIFGILFFSLCACIVPVTAAVPVPDFTADYTSGDNPLQVTFTDTSLDTPTGWAWFFGDESYTEAWTQVNTNATWARRAFHSCVALQDGSIVLMGGYYGVGPALDDVWRSTDYGSTWEMQTLNAEWPARMGSSGVVMPDGSILLIGGEGEPGFSYYNDTWRSTDNGVT